MQGKLMFLAGAGLGYVLGARAGRDRYEQIKQQADTLWHDPRVQDTVTTATEKVKEKAPEVSAKFADAAGQATAKVKAKVGGTNNKGATWDDVDETSAGSESATWPNP